MHDTVKSSAPSAPAAPSAPSAPTAPAARAARGLREARVAVLHGSPATASLVRSLVEQGIGHVRLIGGGADADIAGRGEVNGVEWRADLVPWPDTAEAMHGCLEGADLAVATVGGPILFYDWLARLNEVCHARSLPWLRVSVPSADEIHLGPLVAPGATACHACFELRYKSNIGRLEDYLPFEADQRGQRHGVDFGVPPPMFELCGALGAREAARFLADDGAPETLGRLVVVDPHRPSISRHAVLPLPRCEVCSPPRAAAPELAL
ncbi:MAG TPA: TOMM precursor leader peptide-binding protein [Kofleriaceae bacterium]|nr:TOMM precursor leader peptide-binding protein [Kofleriaceae bacterium]